MARMEHLQQQQSHAAMHGYAVYQAFDEFPIYYIPYKYPYKLNVEEKYWNAPYAHALFNYYWHYTLAIVAFYVFTIYALKRWMHDRKPFHLKVPLFLWNSALAIFSAVGYWRFSEEFWFVIKNRSFQDSVCLTLSPTQPVAFWAFLFAISKIAELFDTVFLVLRKRPLIFLHWYHHAVVLVYSWHAGQKLTAAGRYFMTMNYFVHSIMYSYYALSSIGIRLPRAISMVVTTLQTTQMLIGVGISVYITVLKLSEQPANPLICQQSNENLMFAFAIYFTFAILFVRFFIAAYLTSGADKRTTTSKSNGHIIEKKAMANGATKKIE
jgi:elongation of very long chain fatty acids protein 6